VKLLRSGVGRKKGKGKRGGGDINRKEKASAITKSYALFSVLGRKKGGMGGEGRREALQDFTLEDGKGEGGKRLRLVYLQVFKWEKRGKGAGEILPERKGGEGGKRAKKKSPPPSPLFCKRGEKKGGRFGRGGTLHLQIFPP